MKLSVKLFARARDLAGTGTVSLELPDDCRVADMKQTLAACCPDLKPLLPNLLIAVGNEYANDDMSLNSTSEVACFPPVSGG
jgi:sulfur-carrier protein